METYVLLSHLNDFIFCPRSLYFHQLYGKTDTRLYQRKAQIDGTAAHKAIDEKRYSTRKEVLQGFEVYSTQYGLCGNIDTFNMKTGVLVERKKKIKQVYDGYIFQLYGQYYALVEMGYKVKKLKLYSMDDNKNYPLDLPEDNPAKQKEFEALLERMENYDLSSPFTANPNKCRHCIYSPLCDQALC